MSFEFSLTDSQRGLEMCFEIPERGIVGIYGPSGAGKSSVLRAIAGLLPEADVSVRFQSSDWQQLTVQQRPVAWMGQKPHLFPHWSVAENLDFALKLSGLDPETSHPHLKALEVADLMDRLPTELSGGEYQRICLVRALAMAESDRRQVLLLDEPLSALNETLREQAMQQIAGFRSHRLVLFVSHQLQDMYRLCDHLVVVEEGRVIESADMACAMRSADSLRPLAFHYPLRGGSHLIHADEVALSTVEPQGLSIRHSIAVEVSTVETTDRGCLVHCMDTQQNLILACLTADAVAELQLETGSRAWALFKDSGLKTVF